jgi:hypothetical protein
MAQQSLRNYTYNATYFVGSTMPINAPAAMQVGDTMVFVGVGDSMTKGFETLAGWTPIQDSKPYGVRLQIFTKAADINDIQTNAQFNWLLDHFSAAILLFAFASTVPIVDRTSFVLSNSNDNVGNIVKGTPITPTGPNEMLLWIAAFALNGSNLDVRVPSSMAAYAYNYSGGGWGNGPNVAAMSVGLASYPGGTTPTTWTDAQAFNQIALTGVTLLTFKTKYAPQEVANPMLYCEA